MSKNRIAPVHPGVYLKELLDELGISQQRLAKNELESASFSRGPFVITFHRSDKRQNRLKD